MRRAAVLLAAALAAAVAAVPARATPYAGVAHEAGAVFRLVGSDRRAWQLEVEADYSEPGTDAAGPYARSLTLRLTQCDARYHCRYARQWQQPLGVDEVDDVSTDGRVVVTTTVLGRALTATYQPVAETGSVTANINSLHLEYREEFTVSATLAFGGASCRSTDGQVVRRTIVDPHSGPYSGGQAAPKSLPKAVSGKLRCA